jgi:hypothetical protein
MFLEQFRQHPLGRHVSLQFQQLSQLTPHQVSVQAAANRVRVFVFMTIPVNNARSAAGRPDVCSTIVSGMLPSTRIHLGRRPAAKLFRR